MLPYIYEDLKEACQNLPVSLAAGCGAAVLAFCVSRIVSRSAQGNSYVAENVLLFLPFGFLFPLLFRFRGQRRFRFPACLFSAFLCSAGIETVQYMTSRGYSQLDDVITNVAGAALGYAVFYTAHRAAGYGRR